MQSIEESYYGGKSQNNKYKIACIPISGYKKSMQISLAPNKSDLFWKFLL